MEDPLAQFFVWWDGPDGKQQAIDQQESTYRIAQRAFAAGYRARYEPDLAPSRDVLPPAPVTDLKKVAAPHFEKRPGEVARITAPPVEPFAHQQVVSDRKWEAWRTQNMFQGPLEPDPFAKARFTGPQQAAIDSLYPLPPAPAAPRTWSGDQVRIDPGKTMAMPVVPDDAEGFELIDRIDIRNLPLSGPAEEL